jgi:hypothetical protein
VQLQFPVTPSWSTNTTSKAPSGEIDAEKGDATALLKRKKTDNHRGMVYNDTKCMGASLVDMQNFGCDRAICHQINGGQSVQLVQERQSDPNPEAYLYYNSNCTGGHKKAHLQAKRTNRCTDINRSNDGFDDDTIRWMSVVFEYVC